MRQFERALRCLLAIQRGDAVSVPWMVEKFGISRAQAKRDMVELERTLPLASERRGSRSVLVPTQDGALA